jgi:hypothetical protein
MPKKSAHNPRKNNLTAGLLVLAFSTALTFFSATEYGTFELIIASGCLSFLALVILFSETR